MAKQPKTQQSSSQLSRTLSGQLSKQEKRTQAYVAITKYKHQAYLAVKAVKQAKFM